MQLHSTAQICRHGPKHMSKNQHHRAQLQVKSTEWGQQERKGLHHQCMRQWQAPCQPLKLVARPATERLHNLASKLAALSMMGLTAFIDATGSSSIGPEVALLKSPSRLGV